MRVEEMYLIKAEAEAMGGNLSGGKSTLENFVRTYRDPSFTSKANSAQDFQDEVWLQRRMELWGEGFSLFDILRLKSRWFVRIRIMTRLYNIIQQQKRRS